MSNSCGGGSESEAGWVVAVGMIRSGRVVVVVVDTFSFWRCTLLCMWQCK